VSATVLARRFNINGRLLARFRNRGEDCHDPWQRTTCSRLLSIPVFVTLSGNLQSVGEIRDRSLGKCGTWSIFLKDLSLWCQSRSLGVGLTNRVPKRKVASRAPNALCDAV
jgi:hypothetical protein